jgi:hypothetical protein
VDLSGNNPDEPNSAEANARKPMSQWLLYPRMPGCCGPIGLNGPIGYDLFLRAGLAFPIGGGLLQHSLQDGLYVEGGGRTLFYNPEMTRAWTATLGVGNFNADSRHFVPSFQMNNIPVHTVIPPSTTGTPGSTSSTGTAGSTTSGTTTPTSGTTGTTTTSSTTGAGTPIIVVVPSLTASVASYNQTWFSVYGGRECYLWGNAECSNQQCSLRAGVEVGGRWATEKVDFNEIRHRTGTAGGVSIAGYTELVVPCQCVIYTFGLRTQYDYIFTDILQSQNVNDLQLFNLLVTVGLRF